VFHGTVESRRLTTAVADLGRPVSAVAFAGPGVRYTLSGDALPVPAPGEKTNGEPGLGAVVATHLAPASADVVAILTTGAVRLYDADERRWHDLLPDGDASAIAYSSDGNVLAVATRAGTVRLWDAVSRTPLTDQLPVGSAVSALTVAGTGREYLVVACPAEGPAVALHCARPFYAPPLRLPNRLGEEVLALDFSPRQAGLYVTSSAGVSLWQLGDDGWYIRRHNYPAGKRYPDADGPGAFSASRVRPSRAGEPESILIGGTAGRLFDVDADADRDRSASALAGAAEVTAVTAGPDGRQVCACGRTKDRKGCVCRWPAGLGGPPDAVQHFDCCIHAQAYLPGATALVLGGGDGKVRVWDPDRSLKTQITLELDCGSPILSVAASEDGRQVVAGCADGSAQLWELESGRRIWTVRHRAEVRAVAFHKGNALTASADGTVRQWHAGTGLALGPPLTHADAVNALAILGELVATGSRDRYVRVWRAP
jgi:WD40 repeat protein